MQPTLIITRPAPDSVRFATAVFDRLGWSVPVIHAPAFRITPLDNVPPAADQLIFTSKNGVAAAIRLNLSRDMPTWCVGDRTAQAARDAGFQSRSASGDATKLIELISDSNPMGRFLHVAGRHTRGAVAQMLTGQGIPCAVCIAYEQIALDPPPSLITAFAGNSPLVSPVFSPRSAAPLVLPDRVAPLHGVAISPAVAEVLIALPVDTVDTAERPDEKAMIVTTCDVLTRIADRA